MKAMRSRSQMEVAFQHLEAHMLFICPECGETFNSQQQWRQHLNFHHDYLCKKPEDFSFVEINDRFHECQICNAMVADGKRAIALLQYHRFLHLPFSRTYRCRHCPASFTRKRVLCEHLCRSHERIVGENVTETHLNMLCPRSTKEETTKINKIESTKMGDQLKNEAKDNSEFYMRYICPQCGVLIENYKKWMTHIKTSHTDVVRSDCEMQRVSGTKNYYCKICRKVIFSNENAKLQRHYFTHLPYKVNFHCKFCKVRRAFKTELLHHFIRTHLKEFEMQRTHVRKPQEWGAETNKKLDKELDLLLKCGSGYASKGLNSMKFTSTTILNSYSQAKNEKTEVEQLERQRSAGRKDENRSVVTSYIDEYIKETGISSHPSNKRNWNQMNKNTTQNQQKNSGELIQNVKSVHKNGLEALCAEIFGDIELEEKQLLQSNEQLDKRPVATNYDNFAFNEEDNTGQEQIVSIEINALDENEKVQLEEAETDQSTESAVPNKRTKLNDTFETNTFSTKPKCYSTIKSLFSAKILHLCPKCGKSFGEQSVWRDHVLTAHENLNKMIEDSYKLLDDQDSNLCLNCMQVLVTMDKSELQRHCFTHMPYHAYLKCTLCGTAKSNKSKMLQHLEMEHGTLLQTKNLMNTKDDIPEERFFKDIGFKQEPEKEKAPSLNLEKRELMSHLLKARDRLNRMLESKMFGQD